MTGLVPFFGYYGGKWRDTPKNYPPPVHGIIVEPFAGSAGYSLRYPDREIILCDIDPVVCSVWDYLVHVEPSEILAIPDLNGDEDVDDLDCSEEAKWLVGFWLNRAVARPRKSPSKWMREGIRPGSFWGPRVRETIASQVQHIRHWKVLNQSYAALEFDGEATWFVDPPYQRAGRHYRFGSKHIDYPHLAEWCKSRRGQVIACENDDATWLPFRALRDVKTTRAGKRSKEAVWLGDEHREAA